MRKQAGFYILAFMVILGGAVGSAWPQSINVNTPIHTNQKFDPKQPMQTWKCSTTQLGVTNELDFLDTNGAVGSYVDCHGVIHGGTGGPIITVNGGASLSDVNFDDTAPVAAACSELVTWQYSPDNLSAQLLLTLGDQCHRIDLSKLAGDFAAQVTAGAALCPSSGCVLDGTGDAGTSPTAAVNVTPPAKSVLILPADTLTLANGVSIVPASNARITGYGQASIIAKTNTTAMLTGGGGDPSPIIGNSDPSIFANPDNAEFDHFVLNGTSSSTARIPVTAVAASIAGNATYTTADTATCAANACAGLQAFAANFAGRDNEGQYTVLSSTNLEIILTNANASLEASPVDAFITIIGAWGINLAPTNSSFHDLEFHSDLGLALQGSGCTCYNNGDNLNIRSPHGALYLGPNANSNNFRRLTLWATDQNGGNFTLATGFALRVNNGGSNVFDGVDDENTKYTRIKAGAITIANLDWENSQTNQNSAYGLVSIPTLENGAANVKINGNWDVVDNANGLGQGNPSNSFGSQANGQRLGFPSYGSFAVNHVPSPSAMSIAQTGAGAHTYQYYLTAVDFLNNKSLPTAYASATNASPLDGTHYFTLGRGLASIGTKCWDITVSVDSAPVQLVNGCTPQAGFNFIDNGSITYGSYTVPTRNTTGDASIDGWAIPAVVATGTASNTDLAGIMVSSAGTASYTLTDTYAVAPVCIYQDLTTIASLLTVTTTTTTLGATTTGASDHVSYICVARN